MRQDFVYRSLEDKPQAWANYRRLLEQNVCSSGGGQLLQCVVRPHDESFARLRIHELRRHSPCMQTLAELTYAPQDRVCSYSLLSHSACSSQSPTATGRHAV